MSYRFAAHGTLKLTVTGNILHVEGTGPWNLESLRRSAEEVRPKIQQLEGKPWTVMVILRGEPIYVPPAATSLIETIIEEKQKGRVATAILVNSCDAPGFAKLHMADIYGKAGENFEFFDDVDLAQQWLETQIKYSDY